MTDMERIFAEEYLIDLNAMAAALRAGYKRSTARNAASWIDEAHPKKPRVRELIDKHMAERSRRTGITQDRVLRELARVGFANVTDIIDRQTGGIRQDASRDDTAAVTSTRCRETEDGAEWEVKMTDKVKALELIGRHLGMFTDNVKIDGSVPVVVDDIPAQKPPEA